MALLDWNINWLKHVVAHHRLQSTIGVDHCTFPIVLRPSRPHLDFISQFVPRQLIYSVFIDISLALDFVYPLFTSSTFNSGLSYDLTCCCMMRKRTQIWRIEWSPWTFTFYRAISMFNVAVQECEFLPGNTWPIHFGLVGCTLSGIEWKCATSILLTVNYIFRFHNAKAYSSLGFCKIPLLII